MSGPASTSWRSAPPIPPEANATGSNDGPNAPRNVQPQRRGNSSYRGRRPDRKIASPARKGRNYLPLLSETFVPSSENAQPNDIPSKASRSNPAHSPTSNQLWQSQPTDSSNGRQQSQQHKSPRGKGRGKSNSGIPRDMLYEQRKAHKEAKEEFERMMENQGLQQEVLSPNITETPLINGNDHDKSSSKQQHRHRQPKVDENIDVMTTFTLHQTAIRDEPIESLRRQYLNPTQKVSPEQLRSLRSLIHPEGQLAKSSFVTKPLSAAELEGKKRCNDCNKQLGVYPRLVDYEAEAQIYSVLELQQSASLPPGPDGYEAPKLHDLKCKFHTGYSFNNTWTCCGMSVFDKTFKGCRARAGHEPKTYKNNEIENRWQYQKTPSARMHTDARAAIAIDCEMGTAASGDSELIRISAIDCFSGKILVDKLVYPTVDMQHYNTKYSGVTRGDMERAKRTRTCFTSKQQVLETIWKFTDERTVVVGHSLQNDLTALRWIHPIIVDSYIIENNLLQQKRAEEVKKLEAERMQRIKDMLAQGLSSKEVDAILDAEAAEEKVARKKRAEEESKARQGQRTKGTGALALKVLTKAHCGRDIQMGRVGHDSVEDAMAARDVVFWHVEQALNGEKKDQAEAVGDLIDLNNDLIGLEL